MIGDHLGELVDKKDNIRMDLKEKEDVMGWTGSI
jgi:hypothetical protein